MFDLLIAILGLVGVIKSADFFITHSVSLAKKFKISNFLIGYTIVAMGTSCPELIISLYSSFLGHTSIALSNVVGSNIANTCIIIGFLAIYKPYKLSKTDVVLNLPLNILLTAIFLALVLLNGNFIYHLTGLLLLAIFFATFVITKKFNNHNIKVKSDTKFNPYIFTSSLIALVFFSKLCVDYLLHFSKTFGIEESILGYFIIAIGTSLPELITSFVAIKKGNAEIGIGNILGSNIFNLLFILGLSSQFTTLDMSGYIEEIIFLIYISVSLVLLTFIGKKYLISWSEGLFLLLNYAVFVGIEFL